MMYKESRESIEQLITDYFDGIFNGDVDKLDACFHENTHLYGDIKGADYLKSKQEYLETVKNRQSPSALGEEFQMSVIGLEIIGKIAMAKLHVPFSGYNYYDYLSLSQIDGSWKIVNKVFIHV
ncbi:nuclear transport factor 2 family protein [Flagellimonas alvinocaridis]|nr:nuclear transport factor 2 family protein [Allomuricauda alvinocaridis]